MSQVDIVNYNYMEEVNSKLQWSTIKAYDCLSSLKLMSSCFASPILFTLNSRYFQEKHIPNEA